MENWCRLCADMKLPEELVHSIDDQTLNIEQKLIDCCRWCSFDVDESERMPKLICNVCFQKLEYSWAFAECVALAQQKLQAYTTFDAKPRIFLQIEKDHGLSYIGHQAVKEETQEFIVPHDSSAYFESELDVPMSLDNSNRFAIPNDKKSNCNKLPVEIIEMTKFDFDLMSSLSECDKNDDGTVNEEKIAELNLDNWSIVKWQCCVCEALVNKYRTLRSHFKRMHSNKTWKLPCPLCKASSTNKNSLYKHIINIHRSYLKFW